MRGHLLVHCQFNINTCLYGSRGGFKDPAVAVVVVSVGIGVDRSTLSTHH